MEYQLETVTVDRNKLQDELMAIKQDNNALQVEKKLFDQKLIIMQEENSNLRLNKSNNDVQTNYYLKTIKINEENLSKLSEELKIEKFNNETNKNKSEVMQVQINDLRKINKMLEKEL